MTRLVAGLLLQPGRFALGYNLSMSTPWQPQLLTMNDQADFAPAAQLLDEGSQYHTDNARELFDDLGYAGKNTNPWKKL